MSRFIIVVVVAVLLPFIHAFTSTNLYSRQILFSGKPTTVVTAQYTATNFDNTGTFVLDSGCTGTITVFPPSYNYVVQQIGNVPTDVVSVEEISCSVIDIDAYRTNLEANGETLDLVFNYDGDNMTIINGTSPSAMRRRLLQLNNDPDYDVQADLIRAFAATSTVLSDESRLSLDAADAALYGVISTYIPVDFLPSDNPGLLGASNDQHLKNAQQRQIDVDKKLIQRGQNTDAAVQFLTQFVVDAYIQQQTSLSQLFALQNETTLAVIYLFNALIQSLENQQSLNLYTGLAIQGLLDYRQADRSEFQAWINNNELKDLATALYFYDVAQLPAGYEPFVRHPGIAPNSTALGEFSADMRILIDTITTDTVAFLNYNSAGPTYRIAGVTQNSFTTYMSTEFALLFPSDQIDSRVLMGILGPAGCTPPALNSSVQYIDVTQWGSSIGWRSPTVDQTFNNSVTCDMWVEATFCECSWSCDQFHGQCLSELNPSTITFTWENSTGFQTGQNPPLAMFCNESLRAGVPDQLAQDPTLTCSSMIITTPSQLQSALNIDFCGQGIVNSVNVSYVGPFVSGTGNGVFQIDLLFFFSYRLQLRGNTTVNDCALSNYYAATGGSFALFPSGLASPVTNYMAITVAAFQYMQPTLARARLAKFGRLAGVETVTVPTNLYISTQFDSNGNVILDGSANPLRCEKSFWNAYSSTTIPVYNFVANSANLVTNNIQVAITCPPCNNTDACYDITQNITQNVMTFNPGSFLLDSNFNVMGNLGQFDSLGFTGYDVPTSQLSVSPIIESRSFSPTYILLPSDQTTMPDWNTFLSLQPRNIRYSAAYGGMSPQAYAQSMVISQGHIACNSSATARIPGSHLCTILDAYTYTSQNIGQQAAFSPHNWAVSFSVTVPSGQFFDTVDLANTCPLISLRPSASGSLFLVMQNDAVIATQVIVSYVPLDSNSGIACPSACCNDGQTIQISPRFVAYFEIAACGFVNLSITVVSVQSNGDFLGCFNASGQSLNSQIVTAATALGVNFTNSFNFTQVYNNLLADFYVQSAYQAMLDYQVSLADTSARGQALIAQLTARRDAFQQQIADIQTLTGFTPTFPLNTTLLQETIQGLLDNNTAIDNEILTVDIPYMENELSKVTDKSDLGQFIQEVVQGGKDALVGLGDLLAAGGQAALDALKGLFNGSDCTGFLGSVACWFNDLFSTLLTIATIVVAVIVGCCLLYYCGGPLLGFLGHKLEHERKQREKRLDANKLRKERGAKRSFLGARMQSHVSDAETADDGEITALAPNPEGEGEGEPTTVPVRPLRTFHPRRLS